MEENREISYIVRMLLTTIGSYGIIRGLTSCALFQVSDMAVIFGILAAAVICVYGLYGRKKHFLTVTGIIFAGLSVLSFGILRAGFCHIYNDCMTALEKPYGLSLGRIAVKETAARPMQETIAVQQQSLSFTCTVCWGHCFLFCRCLFYSYRWEQSRTAVHFFCVSATCLVFRLCRGKKAGNSSH